MLHSQKIWIALQKQCASSIVNGRGEELAFGRIYNFQKRRIYHFGEQVYLLYNVGERWYNSRDRRGNKER